MKTGSISHKYSVFEVFVQFDVTGYVQMFVYMYKLVSVYGFEGTILMCYPRSKCESISC
jgi:hypothetical protein